MQICGEMSPAFTSDSDTLRTAKRNVHVQHECHCEQQSIMGRGRKGVGTRALTQMSGAGVVGVFLLAKRVAG